MRTASCRQTCTVAAAAPTGREPPLPAQLASTIGGNPILGVQRLREDAESCAPLANRVTGLPVVEPPTTKL
jgi:hypothetical protein